MRIVTRMMMKLFLSCREMSAAESEALDRCPPLLRRYRMTIHRRMCAHCAKVHSQFRWLNSNASKANEYWTTADSELGDDAKLRIKRALEEEADDG